MAHIVTLGYFHLCLGPTIGNFLLRGIGKPFMAAIVKPVRRTYCTVCHMLWRLRYFLPCMKFVLTWWCLQFIFKLTESNHFALNLSRLCFVMLGLIALLDLSPCTTTGLMHRTFDKEDSHACSTTGLPIHVPQTGLTIASQNNVCVMVSF